MIDAKREIEDVQRAVEGRAVEGADAPAVVLTRIYDGPIDEVWDACTNPARVRRWFLPLSGQLRAGGHYQLEGNAHGTIERCEPPHGFRLTWEFGDDRSWLELRLTEQTDGTTQLELKHIWGSADSDPKWAQYGPGAVGVGWDLALIGLAIHVRSASTVDPTGFASWTASEAGRRYIAMSSQAWGDAAIAAGADPAEARAAATSTTAFYTGMDEASFTS